MRHTIRAAVYAILLSEDMILLSLRKNTGYMDGMYSLPAGHLEKGETLTEALVRETQEEVGIHVQETDLTLCHVLHRCHMKEDIEYIDFYFKVAYWQGDPINNEPERCDLIKWFPLEALPPNIVPTVKRVIDFYKGKLFFSELIEK